MSRISYSFIQFAGRSDGKIKASEPKDNVKRSFLNSL